MDARWRASMIKIRRSSLTATQAPLVIRWLGWRSWISLRAKAGGNGVVVVDGGSGGGVIFVVVLCD